MAYNNYRLLTIMQVNRARVSNCWNSPAPFPTRMLQKATWICGEGRLEQDEWSLMADDHIYTLPISTRRQQEFYRDG